AMHLRAQEYLQRGVNYHPLTSPANQFDIKKAKEIAELAIKTYPKSAGAIASQNLLAQIIRPALSLETEKVNIPGEAFRTLVRYKNSPVVYLRVIRTNRTQLQKIEADGYENNWATVLKMLPLKSWSVKLPDPGDYQPHSAEIKVDGLPAGTYIILASFKPDFSLGENMIARQTTYVSNISYIFNQKQNVYVLHRNTGLPLAGATVQLWEQRYDYTVRRSTYEKKEKYSTGKNGELKLVVPKDRQQQFFEITHGKDTLFTNDPYYNYNYDGYNRQQRTTSFLFMDRAIYRPGQTIFFKGIVVNTDSSGKKSTLATNYKTNVELYDANYQKIGSVAVTSNAYGSYNGSFQLPSGIMNGQFFIKDAVNKAQQFFKVEEYKRPKFITEINKPTGTYRLNETVKVTGNAKAYAGNNIDGAKVSYRVVRKVRFPVWWYGGFVGESKIWPPYGREAAMEITNGETVTDADGNFEISFKAIPDETINKKDQPIFYYEVTADVTDVNGETRSGETMVAVAYQALKLEVTAADKMPADSIASILLSSKNMNDVFEQARVNLVVYQLKQPATMYRKRYWEVPDQFVMTKAEFNAAFPNDPYSNEDQPATWPLGTAIINVTDTTTASGKFNIPAVKHATGWYKIIATTTDKYGEAVTLEKYVYLVAEKSPAGREPAIVQVKNKMAEPGESFVYNIHTGFDKVWLIHNMVNANGKQTTSYHNVAPGKPFGNSLAATEADRGGIMLNYVFVQHNRVYEGDEWLNVPWSNKELQVSYETFRDKILEGSNEKWSVTIKGSKGEKTSAELLVNMYDASLDQFAPHTWNKLSSLWPSNIAGMDWVADNFTSISSITKEDMPVDAVEPEPITYDALVNNGWNEGYFDRIMYMRAEAQEVGAPAPQGKADDAGNQNKRTAKEEEVMADSTATSVAPPPAANEGVQLRKNFNETAFFFPSLETDAAGNVTFSFTIPEALTKWKLMTFAHNEELANGYSEKTVTTQKPLMVQPNAPRFIREGDRIELVTKLVNMSDKELTGTVQLQLMNAASNESVDGWFKNVFPNQYFTVAAGQSVAVKFPLEIPYNFNSALAYQIKAITKDGVFSDGEEAAMPVLTNRMLVTETFPLNMRKSNSKQFSFTKLLNSFAAGSRNDATLTHHALTFEYTSNPAWYAVQALPYLADASLDNAEQQFTRYYANALAGFVANSNPKIKAVFEKWKLTDTAALLSNLQKNEELKNALLEETPWVLEAKTETEQKKNIALLFDMVGMANEKVAALNKLKEMQSSNGGFTWFKGGPDDRYMTQYI
ncbi:MAG: alpha-2-macroglobulin, partial [Chitinophagaceae bacterium]